MKIGIVQMRSGSVIDDNVVAMEMLVREAADKGAVYIQTPEMTGILEKTREALFAQIRVQEEDLLVRRSSELALELGIWLHIGSHAIKLDDSTAANRAFVFGPEGSILTTYDKIHMFDVDLPNGESWRESNTYQPGRVSKLLDVNGVKTGLSICYDVRFPHLYRQLALNGVEILTGPAAFTRQTGQAHWHILHRARAVENGAFMVSAAQGGKHADGRETFGHSLIVNPWGEVISEIQGDEPGVAVAEIDVSEVAKARARHSKPCQQSGFCASKHDLKSYGVNVIKYSLICNEAHAFEAWFGSSDDFDNQSKCGLVECPVCGSTDVSKALMTPGVAGTKKTSADDAKLPVASMPAVPHLPAEMVEQLRQFKKHVEANSENVGDKFPEEARKIHYGETEARGIYGKASIEEAAELMEEGVGVMPIPDLPEEKN